MEKRTYAELLRRSRMKNGMSLKEVCGGICNTTTLANYENGERVPDIFLFGYFMERMGEASENFALMVTEAEYKYYTWKENVLDSIEQKAWDKLEQLLQQNIAIENLKNERIQKQFYYYAKGIFKAEKEKNYIETTECFKLAIEQTIPNMFGIEQEETVFGTMELHMIVVYLYYGILGNVLEKEKGEQLFYILERYIDKKRMAKNEKSKIYPKLICVGCYVLKDRIGKKEQTLLCEKAIGLLRKAKTFYDITELLQIYIGLLREKEDETLVFYQKQYEVFVDLLKRGNAETEFRVELCYARVPKLYILHEYLSSKRLEKKWTKEKASEGICEPENYSKIERGKQLPKTKKMELLAEKLDINWCYYRGELDTDNLEAYHLRRKHRIAELEGRFEDDLKALQDLERILDMKIPVNYQYVKGCECLVKYRMGQITAEEAYTKTKKILDLTMTLDLQNQNLVYYSQTELELITQMSEFLRKQEKSEDGIWLLESVLKQMIRGTVSLECQWNGVSYALRVLSGLYFSIGKHEQSNCIMEYVLKRNIKLREAGNLPSILDAIADNLEHIGEQYSKEYKKLYCQTYYMADFFEFDNIKPLAKRYYEENFDGNIKWY